MNEWVSDGMNAVKPKQKVGLKAKIYFSNKYMNKN